MGGKWQPNRRSLTPVVDPRQGPHYPRLFRFLGVESGLLKTFRPHRPSPGAKLLQTLPASEYRESSCRATHTDEKEQKG